MKFDSEKMTVLIEEKDTESHPARVRGLKRKILKISLDLNIVKWENRIKTNS